LIQQRRKRRTATSAVEITLFQVVNTPAGPYFWNPHKVGVASAAALLGATLGLVGGSMLGLHFEDSLFSALVGLTCSALGAVVGFLNTLRA